jgi:N-acetylneuraminic acid mutarotase
MRHLQRLVTHLTLGALSLALASCGDQPTQPSLPAEPASVAVASAPAPDTWIQRAQDPVDRVGFVTATVPNAAGQSIVYVIGGWEYGDAQGMKLVEAYNVATNRWSRKRDLPIGLTNFNGAGVIGGKIYIAGGQKKNGGWSTYTLFVYDPAKDTWTRRAGPPVRGAYGVTGVIGDKLYVAEELKWDADHSDFIRYDPATNKWATLPSPKHAHHMGDVLYGKLYLVGNQTEMYDPATNQWTEKAPAPMAGRIAVAAQAKLYVFTTDQYPRRTLVYDPLSDSWTVRGPGPVPWEPTATRVFVDGKPRIEVIGTFAPSNYQYVP